MQRLRQRGFVEHLWRRRPAGSLQQHAEILRFPRGSDLRVARKNPFDERRAGARHTHDEDRCAGDLVARQVRAGRCRQDLREETRDRVEQALVPLESISCGRMLARIAGEQVCERLVVPPQVFQFLGERVTQVQFGVGIERTGRKQPFEPREVVTLRRLPSGRRERRVCAPEVRIAAHARLVRRLGLGKASQELERSRMIEMQAGALRVQFDRTLETRNGLLMATSAAQHDADGVPAWRRLRHERRALARQPPALRRCG